MIQRSFAVLLAIFLALSLAGPPDGLGQQDQKEPEKKGKGPGGFGGPMGQDRPLVKQFDKDGDGRLNQDERQAAREFPKKAAASEVKPAEARKEEKTP